MCVIKKNAFFYLLMALGFIATFGLSLGFLSSESIWPDEALYATQARKLAEDPSCLFSPELLEYHPPLFPILLMPGVLAQDDLIGFRIVTNFISMLGLVAAFSLGRRVQGHFLGAFCFLGLAFNYIYLSQAGRILIDNALSVFLMIFMWAWLSLKETNRPVFKVGLALSAAGLILLKSSGILIIPFLFVLMMWEGRGGRIPTLFRQMRGVLAVVLMTAGLTLGWRYLVSGSIFFNLSALRGLHNVEPWWYFVVYLPSLFNPSFLVWIFLLGAMAILWKGDDRSRSILIWFLFMLTAISLPPEKNLRYSALFLPALFLISGKGLLFIREQVFRRRGNPKTTETVILILVLLVFMLDFPKIQMYLIDRETTFIGFPEAGQWINNHVEDDLLVMSGSKRIMDFFSGKALKRHGKDLVELPDSPSVFAEMVRAHRGPCVVEIDFWQNVKKKHWLLRTRPSPEAYLDGMGFQLAKVVVRRFPQLGRPEPKPLIWLFYRPALDQ